MDLNVEHGVIEEPYKPILRFSTALNDKHGNQAGNHPTQALQRPGYHKLKAGYIHAKRRNPVKSVSRLAYKTIWTVQYQML